MSVCVEVTAESVALEGLNRWEPHRADSGLQRVKPKAAPSHSLRPVTRYKRRRGACTRAVRAAVSWPEGPHTPGIHQWAIGTTSTSYTWSHPHLPAASGATISILNVKVGQSNAVVFNFSLCLNMFPYFIQQEGSTLISMWFVFLSLVPHRFDFSRLLSPSHISKGSCLPKCAAQFCCLLVTCHVHVSGFEHL